MNIEGTFDLGSDHYWWWAGKANPGSPQDYCVHCRSDKFGLTQYLAQAPSQEKAEEIARWLAPRVPAASDSKR